MVFRLLGSWGLSVSLSLSVCLARALARALLFSSSFLGCLLHRLWTYPPQLPLRCRLHSRLLQLLRAQHMGAGVSACTLQAANVALQRDPATASSATVRRWLALLVKRSLYLELTRGSISLHDVKVTRYCVPAWLGLAGLRVMVHFFLEDVYKSRLFVVCFRLVVQPDRA